MPHGFRKLRLRTHRLAELRRFYHQILGFDLEDESVDSVTLRAGTTSLTFTRSGEGEGRPYNHFAFNIPENQLPHAQEWLAQRVPLVRRADGSWVTHFAGWNAHAIYFWDPAGNLGEFIARHDLPNARQGPFTERCILNASEIGVVVNDVPAAARDLKAQLGLKSYRPGSDEFHAVGDEHGLLLVVRKGRPWMNEAHPAAIFPTEVALYGQRTGRCAMEEYPYVMEVAAR